MLFLEIIIILYHLTLVRLLWHCLIKDFKNQNIRKDRSLCIFFYSKNSWNFFVDNEILMAVNYGSKNFLVDLVLQESHYNIFF